MAKKVLIETYGCQMNEADTELMYGLLRKDGYELTTEQGEADVVLLNTCAVREKAEERIFGRLGWLKQLKRERPDVVLGVTGCMAERMREDLVKRTPFVDLVVGPDAYRRLPELVSKLTDRGDDAELAQVKSDPIIDVRLDRSEMYAQAEVDRVPGVSGWISVQRGCDKFCTFCIVPFVRGRERSLSPDEVVAQAKEMAAQGFREVTLLGQTVSSYYEKGCDFADLLSMVHEVEGVERIRFTSPYPTDFTPRLVERMASLPKLGKSLHLPVQSGSSRVLKDMRRRYTRERFLEIIQLVRQHLPDYSLSTDVIVGYPGETEEEFEETMSLMREVRFDQAFMFFYSEREGTLAARQRPDDIPLEVKKRRLAELIKQQEQISHEEQQKQLGATHEVMVVGPTRRDPTQVMGRTSCFRTTIFSQNNAQPYRPGDIVRVNVERATSHTMFATPLEVSNPTPRVVELVEAGEPGLSMHGG
jgi:tRNA-2-methylthio-N6-dimethylallyladenosine synthase